MADDDMMMMIYLYKGVRACGHKLPEEEWRRSSATTNANLLADPRLRKPIKLSNIKHRRDRLKLWPLAGLYMFGKKHINAKDEGQ